MEHYTALMGGLSLAAVALLHRVVAGRALAVSGRYTLIVNRVLDGPAEPEVEMSDEQLIAALEAMATESFGAEAVAAAAAESADSPAADAQPPVTSMPPQPLAMHVLFLLSLALGGALSVALAGDWSALFDLSGAGFHGRYGEGMNPLAVLALLGGGVLVGFGTRMAGGCTSGHGLCGVSRFERGSLLATAVFFGVGVFTTLGIAAVVP